MKEVRWSSDRTTIIRKDSEFVPVQYDIQLNHPNSTPISSNRILRVANRAHSFLISHPIHFQNSHCQNSRWNFLFSRVFNARIYAYICTGCAITTGDVIIPMKIWDKIFFSRFRRITIERFSDRINFDRGGGKHVRFHGSVISPSIQILRGINHCQHRLVELFGQIRSELSMRRLPEARNTRYHVVSKVRTAVPGLDLVKRCGIGATRNGTETRRPSEKESTATSTVKPLIISLVSHKSTDRAAVT